VGSALALASALLFGLSTPVLHHFTATAAGTRAPVGGPFATAALLYGGAVLSALPLRLWRGGGETSLRGKNALRIAAVAVCGAVVAPACLAWGLAHTTGLVASLLLGTEAFFTAALAALFFREPLGRRVWGALALVAIASMLLVTDAQTDLRVPILPALAVLAAAFFWGLDNTLTRPFADLDPRQVVRTKGAVGTCLSLVLMVVLGETRPSASDALGILVTGALGYGTSLHLYLLAQRRIGAARTASIFATAPFLGAAAAWVLGDGTPDRSSLTAAVLVAGALFLHFRETHGHDHHHAALEHDHAHRHDDGHHDHVHDASMAGVNGEHSHPHRHEESHHSHAHGPDLHHQHRH